MNEPNTRENNTGENATPRREQESSGSRQTFLLLGGIFAAVAILWTVASAISFVGREKISTAIRFQGVKSIEFKDIDGNITVIGSANEADGTVSGTRIVRKSLRSPKVRERVLDDGTLQIDTSCPSLFEVSCSTNYELRVPRDMPVRGSTDAGSIRVTNLSGEVKLRSSAGSARAERTSGSLDLSSSAGSVRVTNASGPLRLKSSAGSVKVDDSTSDQIRASSSAGSVRVTAAKAPTFVDATSSAGGVTVVVPRDTQTYNVDASTSAGSTKVSVRTDPDSKRKIRVRSSAGSVTVRYPTTEETT